MGGINQAERRIVTVRVMVGRTDAFAGKPRSYRGFVCAPIHCRSEACPRRGQSDQPGTHKQLLQRQQVRHLGHLIAHLHRRLFQRT